MWLDAPSRSGSERCGTGFPDALDMLVVCVEVRAWVLRRHCSASPMSCRQSSGVGDESALVNAEMRAGVERGTALKNLADRTGLDDIRGLGAAGPDNAVRHQRC